MREYLENQIRNSENFGELLGNLFLLTTYNPEFNKFLTLIRENYWPKTPVEADSNSLWLDLVRRFECYTTEQPNRYWKIVDANDMKALVAGSPLSPNSFYAPDYEGALDHCIVVLNFKPEELL